MLTLLYFFDNILLICCWVIYTIIINYVCIDYLGSDKEKLSELVIGSGGRFKHVKKSYDNILGIVIPDLLMDLMSCHGFFKKKDYVVIPKRPNRMFEYYFSKGFTYFDCSIINLEKIPTEVKVRINAEVTDNS